MVPSPRKRAPSRFEQTWHETDANSFDPACLPISKAPRAWERKQETVVSRDGREKKIWRKYTTRSKTASHDSHDEVEPEEQDSRCRPVKKLQRVKPQEMDIIAKLPKSKKRAFNATRWDRRKSVLPRKKSSTQDVASEIARGPNEDDEADDNILEDIDTSTDSVSEEWDMIDHDEAVPTLVAIVEGDRRRSTFSFTVAEAKEETTEQDAPTPVLFVEEDAPATPDAHDIRPENIPLPESSPLKAASPTKFYVDSTPKALDVPATASHDTATEMTEDEESRPVENADMNGHMNSAIEDEDPMNDATTQDDISKLDDQDLEEEPAVALDEETLDQSVEAETLAIEETATELDQPEDSDMSGLSLVIESFSPQKHETSNATEFEDLVDSPQEKEKSTEASLQLETQQAMEIEESAAMADNAASPYEQVDTTEDDVTTNDKNDVEVATEQIEIEDGQVQPNTLTDEFTSETPKPFSLMDDIADGLTLTPSFSTSRRESTASKLRSPSPPPRPEYGPDEVTATMHLDDTALLKDFLTRAAASKADKAANISRRTSLQARRDSDAVRQALASPRKVLEDKDPNSPSKYDADATLDLSQTLTLNMEQQQLSPMPGQSELENTEEGKASKSSRRSTRTRKSRLPAPASAAPAAQTPKNISIRRGEGDPIVLKKTETQELALITRTNTRKNKQGAVAVNLRLLKLANEAANSSDDSTMSVAEAPTGKKNVRWDETLAYFQEGTDTLANMLADSESLATPDELSGSTSTPSAKKKARQPKEKNEKSEAPKVRRVRGLGAANGTPGKGLLAPASMLPDGVAEEKEAAPEKPQRLPKASKLKKLVVASGSADSVSSPKPTQLPPLEIAPVGVDVATTTKPTKERKSKLASPKKVKLPQPVPTASSVLGEGKENQQKNRGIGGATPKKGLKLPEVVVPPVVESGLPRRRAGRKV